MADTMVTKIIEIDVKASADASAHLKSIADGVKGVEENSAKAGSALQQMTNIVKGFVGYQIFEMIGDKVLGMASALQAASDQSRLLEQRMILVTKNSGDAGVAFQNITDIAVRQGRELDGVAKLYERVQRSSEQMGVTQKGVALITEGVAASLRLAGAGTQEANAAMLQFSQALASGKLGGDEFRSMMENDSVLMKAFADALGTTMGGLRVMSKEGKLGPEELQAAMLKLGADGQNVMQRMIEQAEKLPKTWDQAVAGSKASFVDLVNALQQTAEKSEGFFTKMVEAINKGMRDAAQLIRDHAEVEAEIARQRGQAAAAPKQDVPFESQRIIDIQTSRASAQRDLEAANAQMDKFMKSYAYINDPQHAVLGQRFLGIKDAINIATGSITAFDAQLAKSYEQDPSDLLGGFISGKAQGIPAKVKKTPKGPKSDVDVYMQLQSALQDEADRIDARLQNLEPWEEKALEMNRKLEKADEKMDSATLAMAELQLAQAAEANQYNKREADMQDLIRKSLAKLNEHDAAKKQADYESDIKKFLTQYNQEHLTKDPFEGADAVIKRINEVAWDPQTSDDNVEILVKLMHSVREKAAKQLMGEKDPLKDVAHQMGDAWETEFDRMEGDLLDFSKSVKDIFGDMVLNILKDFAKIEIKQELQPLMQAGKDWMTNTATPFLTGLFSATGNMFEGGIKMFAQGGVINAPTPFTYNGGRSAGVGGEAGPEALVPLRRGADGNLGMAQAPVQVIVQNNGSNTKATTSETTTPGGGRQITVMINDMVEASLGSGRFDSTLSKSFGINRRGT